MDILAENEEIMSQYMGVDAAETFLAVMHYLRNIKLIQTCFKFNLAKDAADNKFVDCEVTCNADFPVTHDRDFDILKKVSFPKVHIINSFGLLAILENNIK